MRSRSAVQRGMRAGHIVAVICAVLASLSHLLIAMRLPLSEGSRRQPYPAVLCVAVMLGLALITAMSIGPLWLPGIAGTLCAVATLRHQP